MGTCLQREVEKALNASQKMVNNDRNPISNGGRAVTELTCEKSKKNVNVRRMSVVIDNPRGKRSAMKKNPWYSFTREARARTMIFTTKRAPYAFKRIFPIVEYGFDMCAIENMDTERR